ncbi:MAG: macrolide transporter subunit MacA [Parvibaculum sp.]|nr:macrolide transporter subunit MacA [Parvibaculum sp.]
MDYENDTAIERTTRRAKALPGRVMETWHGLPGLARWSALGLVALIVIWIGYGFFFGDESTTYRTQTVVRGDIEQTVTALGSLQPKEYVDVGAQVSGQLETVNVEIGDQVKKGDLLAVIDAKVYETEVAGARAKLTDLQSQLAGAEAELVLAKRQYARNINLAKIDAVSRDDLDTSETAMKTTEASIGSLKAQIEQQKATVEGGEANLGYTKIYAPIDGTVTAQVALQGQTLNANQTAPTILTISDLSTMTVEAQVAEADVGKLKAGMPVYFTTLGQTNQRWTSTVRQILPTPEIVNDVVLYTVLVDIANPDGLLMKDMTAQVFFLLGEARDVLTVPVGAIKDGPNGTKTVTVMTNKGPQSREVEIGIQNRISAEIKSGLEEGDMVVTGTVSADSGTSSGRSRPGFL